MASVVQQILREGIVFGVLAGSWEELTTKVGQAMEARGMSTSEYTMAMVDNVKTNGPYLVIAPGTALLHARPDQGALRNGLLMGTATPPVEFGHSSNDPVSLFLALSATGDMDHVEILQAVAMLLAQPGALVRLQQAASEEEFLAVLADLESNNTGDTRPN